LRREPIRLGIGRHDWQGQGHGVLRASKQLTEHARARSDGGA
jgi:hypothetical protein